MSSEQLNLMHYDENIAQKQHMLLTYYLCKLIVIIDSHTTKCTQGKLIVSE